MNRRRIGLIATAAMAAAAGVFWRLRSEQAPTTSESDEALAGFWALRFDQPDGQSLALASLRGRPLLLNFWATWCPPCVREMPLIDRFHQEHRAQGWQVLGVAIDRREPVQEFLLKQPVGYPIALAGLEGTELSRSLGNERGGLPFTVLFNAAGRIAQRKLGEVTAEELRSWVT